MKQQEITTTNLADFGARERRLLIDLLQAWEEQGLPEEFCEEEVQVMMNRNSGNVFLTNSECQCSMMNGKALKLWYYCGNCGHEGFAEDCQLNEEGCNCCNEPEDQ